MLYAITHRNQFRYTSKVSVAQLLGHLRPRATARQELLEFQLFLDPVATLLSEHLDYYGNHTSYFAVEEPHQELSITARSCVRIAEQMDDLSQSPAWEEVRDECSLHGPNPLLEIGEFLGSSQHIDVGRAYADYAAMFFTARRPFRDALTSFIAGIYHDFTFDPAATTISTPVSDVFRNRRGVCQDFAHLAISCLRSLGLPTRYVSGFLETLPPPGRFRLVGADASHAWFSVWCPGAGWIDADPTNNLLVGERHITLAWGRDYADVSPLRGVLLGGGRQRLRVGIDVQRLLEPGFPGC